MPLKTMSYSNIVCLARSFSTEKGVATPTLVAILGLNNTPPATRKISALRGVTCLWGSEK